MSRAGHGAGFFDHSLDDDIESKLIKGANKLGEYPSVETYDDKISVSGGRIFAEGGVISGDKKYQYGITFQLVTPESAEEGDYEEQGWEREYEEAELQDILKDAVNRYGIHEPSSSDVTSHTWWSSVMPDENKDYWEKGHEKYYSLHVKNVDGSDISDDEAKFINSKLKEGRKLDWDESDKEWWAEGGVMTN